MLDLLTRALLPHVDLFLAETMSCIAEALAALRAVRPTAKPAWISFTLAASDGPPCLRSGEPVPEAVATAAGQGAAAIVFNCSPPEIMGAAVEAARAILGPAGPAIGVYANAFPENAANAANATVTKLREDISPARYADWWLDWRRRGASFIGCCCCIGPEHIRHLRSDSPAD